MNKIFPEEIDWFISTQQTKNKITHCTVKLNNMSLNDHVLSSIHKEQVYSLAFCINITHM